jgi:hypothetical protein
MGIEQQLLPEERLVVSQRRHVGIDLFLPAGHLLKGVEERDQVHFLAALHLHARKHRDAAVSGSADHRGHVLRRVVIGDSYDLQPQFLRPLHDQFWEHLQFGAGRKARVNVQVGDKEG